MRADAADRILAAPSSEASQPSVSIPRIFALGFVLPFAHLHRVILAGLIPALLIGGFFLSPVGGDAIAWVNAFSERYAQRVGMGPAPAPVLTPSPTAIGWAFLALSLAMALWLCAWQRGAARGFAEPIGRWLMRSLLRFPGYAVALVLWQLAPFIVTLPATFLIGWALRRSMLMAKYGVPNGLGLNAEMLTPVQWWVAGIGALTFALAGLWLSARLCPLPAVVAGQGWRGAFGRAWRASAGHGFGLSVSMLGYALISVLLIFVVSTLTLLIVIMPEGPTDVTTLGLMSAHITMIVSVVMTAVVLFWYTAIAALLVRESASLDDPLDLATFD